MTMRASLLTLVLAAACGRTMISSLDTRSTMAPPDAFECVMKTFEAEGFKRTSYDKDELRTAARRVNPKITFSNVQFQKAFDVIQVDIGSGASGETDMKVTASTVAEYFSQAGQVFETQTTSPEAQEAARTIASRCGG
ncbi:MAG: hypothetical protein ACREOC_00865 [Gemmatimonadales bacterium]